MKDVLTAEEVAELCGCSVETINDCAASGDLPHLKLGRSYVFPRDALMERLNEKAIEAAEEIRRVADAVQRKLRGIETPEEIAIEQWKRKLAKVPQSPSIFKNLQTPPDLRGRLDELKRQAMLPDEKWGHDILKFAANVKPDPQL